MKARGFTVVELLIVIIIMAILLTLAVVNVRSTQANARDTERHVDVENIATALESFYTKTIDGYSQTYPGTMLTQYYLTSSINPNPLLDSLDHKSLRAPGVSDEDSASLVMATNATQNPSSVSPQPTTQGTTYVYQPVDNNGALCIIRSSNCVKFAIYYRTEKDTPSNTAAECTDTLCVYRSSHR